MRSENCWKCGIISSTPTLSCLKMFGESGATFEEPEHRERDPALGLLLVIELVALLRKTVDLQPGRMARAHNPIFQYQILDVKGLQQGVLAQRDFSLRKRSHRTSDCVN
jgi:hypothetical protein